MVHEGDDCLGPTNVDTEIHMYIIARKVLLLKMLMCGIICLSLQQELLWRVKLNIGVGPGGL